MKTIQTLLPVTLLSMTTAFQAPMQTSSAISVMRSRGQPFGVASVALNAAKDDKEEAMFSGSDPSSSGRTEVYNIPTGTKKEVKWKDVDIAANTNVELSWWAW